MQYVYSKIDYLTQIQIYQNTNVNIDTFIFHYSMTQWYQALVIRALRRVLKKTYGIEINLAETYELIKQKYKETVDKIIQDMLKNEVYLKKTVIPIPISLVVVPEEQEENPETAAAQETSQMKVNASKIEGKNKGV